MSLVLINATYRTFNAQLHTAQDFACEGMNYYSPEASNVRRAVFDSMQEPSGCANYTVDNCVAKQLFSRKPELFFFPSHGLSGLPKAQLVNWLRTLQKELKYTSGNVATKFTSFHPSFQQTLVDLIEFLEAHEYVYAAS